MGATLWEGVVRLTIALTLILAGCGSSWTIRKDSELAVGCVLSNFYLDSDEDGWGDGSEPPEQACEAIREENRTASNGRDCDEGDPDITGLVGALCPANLITVQPTDTAIQYAGVLFDESEFVFVFGQSTQTQRYTVGDIACEGWAGADPVDETWIARGQLATFGSEAELDAVKSRIEDAVGDSVYAGFIGIEWEGSSVDSGSWSWVDEESSDTLIEQAMDWCGGVAPSPLDFFPNLNPDNPDHAPAINQEMQRVRIAMILEDNGQWCLGVPSDAVMEGDAMDGLYTHTLGHFVCKRTKPNVADYTESVQSE